MKTMIIYFTKSGHTKEIADAMAKEIGITAQSIGENPQVEAVDLLLIGTGIYGGKPSPELEVFLGRLNGKSVKKAVLFSTSMAGIPQSKRVREVLQEKGIEVADEEFSCKGKFLFFSANHPNNADLQAAAQFANKLK